jgi:hypothetical protein
MRPHSNRSTSTYTGALSPSTELAILNPQLVQAVASPTITVQPDSRAWCPAPNQVAGFTYSPITRSGFFSFAVKMRTSTYTRDKKAEAIE